MLFRSNRVRLAEAVEFNIQRVFHVVQNVRKKWIEIIAEK